MSSFNQDLKWLEAKKAVGNNEWIEIISYYRSIGGQNVFVYCVGNGDKRLIVDVIDENDNVLLINKTGEPVIDTYDNVLNSRKVFTYSDNSENMKFSVGDMKYIIAIERK